MPAAQNDPLRGGSAGADPGRDRPGQSRIRHRFAPLSLFRLAERNLATPARSPLLTNLALLGRVSSQEWMARRRIPSFPDDACVPLDETSDVLFRCSRAPWDFRWRTYAQESAFAHELAARGRPFAVTDEPDRIFDKSVVWFLPQGFFRRPLWNYSLQVQQFARGLEAQGNRLFCSSEELAYWENKAYMHRRLADIGAPTPATRLVTRENLESMDFDLEPVLIKEEHSHGSSGIHYFARARDARAFLASYPFRPTESLIMQEVVAGATRDLRVTIVGDELVSSASYWRTKSDAARAGTDWTTTATTYGSSVEHGNVPDAAVKFAVRCLRELNVRTAGVDLMWVNDDLTTEPLILEFSPYYQPNPPKPARYENLSYGEFKKNWDAEDGYLARLYYAYREIAAKVLDQGLY